MGFSGWWRGWARWWWGSATGGRAGVVGGEGVIGKDVVLVEEGVTTRVEGGGPCCDVSRVGKGA